MKGEDAGMTQVAAVDRAADSAGGRTAVPERESAGSGAWRLVSRAAGPIGTALVVLAVLELLIRGGLISSDSIPPPTRIADAFGHQVVTAAFWTEVGQTLEAWALGLAVAIVIGIPVGLVVGRFTYLEAALRPIIEFLRPIPSVALIPLSVLVFAIGMKMSVFLAAFASVWPILLQAIYGARDIDSVLIETSRCYDVAGVTRFWRVTLPNTAPYLLTGIRVSSSISLILVITAEMVVGAPGLGQAISLAQSGGAQPRLYALIAACGLLGYLINVLLRQVEARLIPWHLSVRRDR